MDAVARFDRSASHFLQVDAYQPLFWRALALITGGFDVLWVAGLAAVLLAAVAGRPSRRAAHALVAFAVAALCVLAVKGLAGRPGPFTVHWPVPDPIARLEHLDSPAVRAVLTGSPALRVRPPGWWPRFVRRAFGSTFPSGHAARAFALAVCAGLLYRRWRWPLLAGAAVVTFSRAYLGVHWLTDALAGALLGTLVGLAFAWYAGALPALSLPHPPGPRNHAGPAGRGRWRR